MIDAGVGGNIARFINHSCKPNCYIQIIDGVIWVRAAKTISKGTELNYNYNTDGEATIQVPLPAGMQESAVSGPDQTRTPVLYLHGFASSPDSTKARYFQERLATHGVPLLAPDFNEPDFTTLTMSRMLEQLAREIERLGTRVTLIGFQSRRCARRARGVAVRGRGRSARCFLPRQ